MTGCTHWYVLDEKARDDSFHGYCKRCYITRTFPTIPQTKEMSDRYRKQQREANEELRMRLVTN